MTATVGTPSAARTSTPDWLLRSEIGLCPCGCIGKRRKGGFVEKTLSGGSTLLRQAIFADDTATAPGLLQTIEPRVKVVTLLGLLVAAAFVQHVAVLVALYGAVLILAAASQLSLRFFVKRVWLFIPIFTGIVVLPATFSFVTPGHIVVPLGTWFGSTVGLTNQGLTSAALIVARVAVSISLVVLLTLTTPWTRLLAAVRGLAVPRMFVLVLGMAYRYLFHLLNAVTDMYTARKARSANRTVDVRAGRAFVSASAGALFGKSYALAEEVHQAMVARGFTGNVRTSQATPIRRADLMWFGGCLISAFTVLGADRVLGS